MRDPRSRTGTFLLAGAAAAAVAVVVLSWITGARPSMDDAVAATDVVLQPTPAAEAPVRQESEDRRALLETPVPMTTPDAVTAAVDTGPSVPAAESEAAERPVDPLAEILDDPAFVAACAAPDTVAPDALGETLAPAQRVLNSFVFEESLRRVEAGLYERMEGYVEGEPFQTTGPKRDGEFTTYSIEDGEARKVVLPRQDYPNAYLLRDSIRKLEKQARGH